MNRPQSRGPGKLQWQERMAGEHPGIFHRGPRVQMSPAALGRSALPQRDEQGPPGLFCTSSGYEKAKVLPVAFQAPRPSKHLPSSLMGCLSLHPLRSIHWPCCTWPVPHLLLLGNCHPSAWNVPDRWPRVSSSCHQGPLPTHTKHLLPQRPLSLLPEPPLKSSPIGRQRGGKDCPPSRGSPMYGQLAGVWGGDGQGRGCLCSSSSLFLMLKAPLHNG